MIQFNELKISADGKTLVIDAKVKDLTYYTNVYIDTIKIDTGDTFLTSGPSSKVIYSNQLSGDNKSVSLTLTASDMNTNFAKTDFTKDILFVYITVKGTPAENTPCGLDNTTTTGVVFYLCPLYKNVMGLIGELNDSCKIPMGLTNIMLEIFAIESAEKMGYYSEVLKYWNKFFKDINTINTSVKCNCNG
jgi:hypothetical protein